MNKLYELITHESTVFIGMIIFIFGALIGVTNIANENPIIYFREYVNVIVTLSPFIFMVWLALKNSIDDHK
jgi:hypothetical protein|tara:strand:+ start:344 stop:556 length:213 start_codon:yes stop_codon:yes gene_type:complete